MNSPVVVFTGALMYSPFHASAQNLLMSVQLSYKLPKRINKKFRSKAVHLPFEFECFVKIYARFRFLYEKNLTVIARVLVKGRFSIENFSIAESFTFAEGVHSHCPKSVVR